MNKKILIVEDDKDFIFILKTKFDAEGFDVVVAGDGEEGFIMAEKEKPDLIISDVLMPKVDGIQMAKKIRASNNMVLIVFLTNIKDNNYAESIKELSGIDYLIKSELRINDIVERIKTKLGLVVPTKKS